MRRARAPPRPAPRRQPPARHDLRLHAQALGLHRRTPRAAALAAAAAPAPPPAPRRRPRRRCLRPRRAQRRGTAHRALEPQAQRVEPLLACSQWLSPSSDWLSESVRATLAAPRPSRRRRRRRRRRAARPLQPPDVRAQFFALAWRHLGRRRRRRRAAALPPPRTHQRRERRVLVGRGRKVEDELCRLRAARTCDRATHQRGERLFAQPGALEHVGEAALEEEPIRLVHLGGGERLLVGLVALEEFAVLGDEGVEQRQRLRSCASLSSTLSSVSSSAAGSRRRRRRGPRSRRRCRRGWGGAERESPRLGGFAAGPSCLSTLAHSQEFAQERATACSVDGACVANC